jgi:hypothetical protein
MSLTVSKYPPMISLAGNPMLFKIITDNLFSSAGVAYAGALYSTGTLLDGDTIVFTWGENSTTITFADTPSDTEIVSAASLEQLRDGLNKNYLLSQDFHIYVSGLNLHIVAREEGEDYDLDIDLSGTSALAIVGTPTAGVDAVMRTFYKLIGQAWKDSGSSATANSFIREDKLTPIQTDDSDVNYGNFDIGDALTSEFERKMPSFPHSSYDCGRIVLGWLLSYFFRYGEEYASSGTYRVSQKAILSTEPMYAINGEIPKWKRREFLAENDNFYDWLQLTSKFLTWHPGDKLTSETMQEKLFFLVWQNVSNVDINVRVHLHFTNPALDSILTAIKIEDVSQFNIIEILSDYISLSLATSVGTDTLVSYDVYLERDDNNTKISEEFTYVMDEYRYSEKKFIFKNSLGFWETLRCYGVSSTSVETSRNIASNSEPREFDENFSEKFTHQNSLTKKKTANTGWLSIAESEWIQDVLLSKEVFQIIENKLYPLVITNSETLLHQEDENLRSVTFEYESAWDETVYATEPNDSLQFGDFNDDYNNDYLI